MLVMQYSEPVNVDTLGRLVKSVLIRSPSMVYRTRMLLIKCLCLYLHRKEMGAYVGDTALIQRIAQCLGDIESVECSTGMEWRNMVEWTCILTIF